MLTRRSIVFGGLAALAGCARPKPRGFSGYAFIANQEGGAIAAVDLEIFAVARHIRVDGAPTAVAVSAHGRQVYALTPENGSIHEILASNLTLLRKLRVADSAVAMRMSPSGDTLYVLCRAPRRLVSLALNPLRMDWMAPLPAEPEDLDVSPDGKTVAVSYGADKGISFADPLRRSVSPLIATSGEIGLVRFHADHLIAANVSERMLSIFDVASRRLMVNLPLAVQPDHLCFKADGGELFVTGAGMDAVVVVEPYYTPQVAKTVLAGHTPGAMAACTPPDSPGYLLVANPESGDVSILDINSKNVVAVTAVGTRPSYIAITPDNQYALVLNQSSGDMAVIRIPNVTRAVNEQRRWKKGPLFMLIPVGSKPVSAAIVGI
jgi:YVTN family beta-propeller protein